MAACGLRGRGRGSGGGNEWTDYIIGSAVPHVVVVVVVRRCVTHKPWIYRPAAHWFSLTATEGASEGEQETGRLNERRVSKGGKQLLTCPQHVTISSS